MWAMAAPPLRDAGPTSPFGRVPRFEKLGVREDDVRRLLVQHLLHLVGDVLARLHVEFLRLLLPGLVVVGARAAGVVLVLDRPHGAAAFDPEAPCTLDELLHLADERM